MDETDISIINTNDSDDLASYFEAKSAGETCTVTITGKYMGTEEGNARISIEEVELTNMPKDDEDLDEMEDDGSEMTGAEMVLSGGADDDE